MNQRFDQPLRLRQAEYSRLAPIVIKAFSVFGLILSAVLLLGLWVEAMAGNDVAPGRWIFAASVAFIPSLLIKVQLWLLTHASHFLEFRPGKLFLSDIGNLPDRNVDGWVLETDPWVPHCKRLKILGHVAVRHIRFHLLLDDPAQIEALAKLLHERFPDREKA